jgi:iron complex transport system permease protein
MLLAMGISFVIALCIGEVDINLATLKSILSRETQGIETTIIHRIRLPRIILALAVGGSLSLAGVILQGIYRNPLVEPYTLGISGGAALGVALVIVMGLSHLAGGYMLPLAGFLGSLLAIGFLYILSSRGGKIKVQSMLLIGVMISFIVSSAMMFLMAITSTENLHGIVFWMMGSLDETNTMLIRSVFWLSLVGLLATYFFVKPLNALRLGETKARHLGVNTEMALRLLFVIASLLTGMSVAVAGVIGFVGLIIPHITRLLVGNDYRILLITSFLGGGTFLILCDLVARTIIAPNELPIGVITGMIGGIIFIIVLGRRQLRML